MMKFLLQDNFLRAVKIIFIGCFFISCGKNDIVRTPGGGVGPTARDQIPTEVVSQLGETHTYGTASGSMRLADNFIGMIARFNAIVYGASERLVYFNGSARISGTISFSKVFSAAYSLRTGVGAHQPPGLSVCPIVNTPYPFNCTARFSNRQFICESVPVHRQNYTIVGEIIGARSPTHDYDVIALEVYGPCALNRSQGFIF